MEGSTQDIASTPVSITVSEPEREQVSMEILSSREQFR